MISCYKPSFGNQVDRLLHKTLTELNLTYGHTVSEEGSIAGGLGLIGGDGEAVLLPVHEHGVVVGKVGVLEVLPLR